MIGRAITLGNTMLATALTSRSEALPVLERRLVAVLDFEVLGEAWPHSHTAVECAEIGRRRPLTQLVVLTFVVLAVAIWRKPHSARRCGTAPIKRAATFSYPLDMAGSAP